MEIPSVTKAYLLLLQWLLLVLVAGLAPDYHHFITTPHQLEREGADPGPGPGLRRRADHGSSAYRGAELQLHSHSRGRGMIRAPRGSLLRNQTFSLFTDD